jgi:hypothetical protein
MAESDDYVRFELQNSKPVDLLDLTGALGAFGDAYKIMSFQLAMSMSLTTLDYL